MSLSKPSKEPTPPPTPPGEFAATNIPLPNSSWLIPPAIDSPHWVTAAEDISTDIPPTDSPHWTTVAEEDLRSKLVKIRDNDKIQEIINVLGGGVPTPCRWTQVYWPPLSEERSTTPPEAPSTREDDQLVEIGNDSDDAHDMGNPKTMGDGNNYSTNFTKRDFMSMSNSEERNLTPPPDHDHNQTMSSQNPPSHPSHPSHPSEPQPELNPLSSLATIPDILAKISQRMTDLQAAENAANEGTSSSTVPQNQQKVDDVTSSFFLDTLAVAAIVMAEEIEDTQAKVALVNAALVPLPASDDEGEGSQLEEDDEEEDEELDEQELEDEEEEDEQDKQSMVVIEEKHTLISMLPSFARRAAADIQVEAIQQEDNSNSNNNNSIDHNPKAAHQYTSLVGPTLSELPFPPSLTVSEYSADLSSSEQDTHTPTCSSLVHKFIAENLKAQGKLSSQDHLPDVVITAFDEIDWSDLLPPPAPIPDKSSLAKLTPTLSSLSKASLNVQVDPADVPLPEDDPFEVPLGVDVDDGQGLPDYEEDLEGVGAQYDEGEDCQVGEVEFEVEDDESDGSQLFVDDHGNNDRRPTREEKGKGKAVPEPEEPDNDNHVNRSMRYLSRQVVDTSTDDEVQQQLQEQSEQDHMQSPRSPVLPYTPAAAARVVTLGTPIAEYADMGTFTANEQMVALKPRPKAAPCPRHGTQIQPSTPPPHSSRVYVHKPRPLSPEEDSPPAYCPLRSPSSPTLHVSRRSSPPYAAHKSSLPGPRESLLHGSTPYTAASYTPAVVPWKLEQDKDLHGFPDLPVPERMPTYTRISTTTDTSPVMPLWFDGFDGVSSSTPFSSPSLFLLTITNHPPKTG